MRRLGAAALLMTSAVFLSRIIGYLREAYIAGRYGAHGTTDAFYAAFTIPDWLNYLVAGGTLSITFLPVYARYLAADDEREANRVLSIVATFVLLIVGLGVVAGEILAEPLTAAFFHKLDPEALAACVRYTRILLPAQLFFIAGGIASATLFARGRFWAAAFAPLLYNGGIILGGVVLGTDDPEALAWGALAGAFAGPFLIPAWDAWRAGARVRPSLGLGHPGFVEWLKLSLPLMIGVSLVSADDWVLRYFAGADEGAISHLNYAKRLVAVPIAVAGQAIGQASMPFFARLFAEGKREELADTFLRTLRAAGVVALLAGAWMVGLAAPLCDLLFRRGAFSAVRDLPPTATYLAIFAAAVPLWALQGLVSRAFYAARNTLTPMLAGTAITLLSLPVYALAWRWKGATGLAVASGIGILGHTLALAALAPRLLPELRTGARRALTGLSAGAVLATLAGAATWGAARGVRALLPATLPLHAVDLVQCAAATTAFAVVVLVAAGPLGVPEPGLVIDRVRRRLRRT